MEEKTIKVIRYLDNDGAWTYLSDITEGEDSVDCYDEAFCVEDAIDFTNFSLMEVKNAFLGFQTENPTRQCQIVKITIQVELLTTLEGEYHELLKFRALNKLSLDEIQALGLTPVMTYMKTKYG